MGDLVWLGALGLLPVVGAPVLSHPRFRGFGGAARVVLSGAAGAAIASFVMTLFTLARLAWSVPSIIIVALALAAGLRAMLLRTPSPPL
ncbi:MAG TPA: hypothetical protein VKG23_18615, partial [Thermoanaerobaculia bacterium]|nr:hypothetical protein [Thermoanaerobaculia bacterium]